MKKTPRKKELYFSSRLKKELLEIFNHPLTVIEASSGYGKTTAVFDYLLTLYRDSYRCQWYTCLTPAPEHAWQGICKLINHADNKLACYLQRLPLPGPDTYSEIAEHMKDLQCSDRMLLIIDNYQLAGFPHPGRLLDALSFHDCPSLHIIVLTQPLPEETRHFINARIYRITSQSLMFEKVDIKSYFEAEHILLRNEPVDFLYQTTEGLAAALHLQMKHYKRNGEFINSTQISQIIEQAFWNHLDYDEQHFLICLSLISSFSERQAAAVLGDGRLPGKYLQLLKSDFIRYQKETHTYHFHHLLLSCLHAKFSHWACPEKENAWKTVGDSCKLTGSLIDAAKCYAEINDFEALFALPFSIDDRYELAHLEHGRIAEKLISDAARSQLTEHPELALSLTLELFIQGQFALHAAYYQVMKQLLNDPKQHYPEQRMRKLSGEFYLMESFKVFNDVNAMCRFHQKAGELLAGATSLYSLKDAWTFGAPSVVYMFWRESGKLSQTCSEVMAGMPCYYQLSNGNGTGAPEVMTAEMQLLSGRTGKAKEISYQALSLAAKMKQDSIFFCAELILARAAILAGDTDAKVFFPSQLEAKERILHLGRQMKNHCTLIKHSTASGGLNLTRREYEIADLIRQRLSVKEIAAKLKIAPSTVSNTMQKIYNKLNIHSKNELIELGVLQQPPTVKHNADGSPQKKTIR